MPLSTDYPNIFQWVSYHGKMTVSQINDEVIEVALADAGGIPDDGRFRGASADEALLKANQALAAWLESNKNFLKIRLSDILHKTKRQLSAVALGIGMRK